MIIELILREQPEIKLEGYERIKLPNGLILSNPIEKRVEVIIKKHPDGRVSVFTDNSDVIKSIASSLEVIDIHAK